MRVCADGLADALADALANGLAHLRKRRDGHVGRAFRVRDCARPGGNARARVLGLNGHARTRAVYIHFDHARRERP